jgi:hypothetical protein
MLNEIDAGITQLENALQIQYFTPDKYKQLTGIQSKHNGTKLCINNVIDPNTYESQYMIKANNGCLAVRNSNTYSVEQCNPHDKSQKFAHKYILDSTDYTKHVDFGTISDTTHYPFLIMQSVHNKNCLTSKSRGLSVEPCMDTMSQQWQGV